MNAVHTVPFAGVGNTWMKVRVLFCVRVCQEESV